MKICSHCGRKAVARGLCATLYQQLVRPISPNDAAKQERRAHIPPPPKGSNPIEGNGARAFFCRLYDGCVNFAERAGWGGYSCKACPLAASDVQGREAALVRIATNRSAA